MVVRAPQEEEEKQQQNCIVASIRRLISLCGKRAETRCKEDGRWERRCSSAATRLYLDSCGCDLDSKTVHRWGWRACRVVAQALWSDKLLQWTCHCMAVRTSTPTPSLSLPESRVLRARVRKKAKRIRNCVPKWCRTHCKTLICPKPSTPVNLNPNWKIIENETYEPRYTYTHTYM